MTQTEHPLIVSKQVEFIKSLGYSVYMRKPNDEYCFYTDGTQIAYAQWSRSGGGVSTVHKPNQYTGTGYSISDNITAGTLKKALLTLTPHWASHDKSSVKKYRDWAEFHNRDAFNRALFQV